MIELVIDNLLPNVRKLFASGSCGQNDIGAKMNYPMIISEMSNKTRKVSFFLF